MRGALAAAAAGLLFYFGTGLHPVPGLACAAIAVVLWYAPLAARTRDAAAVAFVAHLAGGLGMARLYARVLAPPAVVIALVVPALALAAVVSLARFVAPRVPGAARVFVFPAAWTATELLVASASPHGTSGSLAYTLAGAPTLLAPAAIGGTSAIVFCLTAAASALACAVHGRALAGPAAALVVVAALFAGARVAAPPEGTASVRVGLASSPIGDDAFGTEDAAAALATVDRHAALARALGAQGAAVVVLPEKMVTLRDAWRDEAIARLAAAAREARVTLVAGLDDRPAGAPRRNVGLVLDPEGRVVAAYEKEHPVPGWEDAYRTGADLAWASPGVGVAICKDMDFSAPARRYAEAGAELLLVPAWDFALDDEAHARMAIVRAVEGHFALARAARDGRLTIADAHGRIVAEVPTPNGSDATLVADVPLGGGRTVYARAGDAFGWLVALAALALTLGAICTRRR
jgi:apolipoprotein N-acyltransferase